MTVDPSQAGRGSRVRLAISTIPASLKKLIYYSLIEKMFLKPAFCTV